MQEQDKLKQQADAVQKFLSNEGVTLPRGKALDLVARLCGDKEWNSLIARLKATAPGTRIPRCADVLRDILKMMEFAKEGLNTANDVLKDFTETGGDPDYAYQKEERALAEAIEQVKAIVSGDRPVKDEKRPAEEFTLFVFTSIESGCNVQFLVPSSVDIVKLEAQLHAWVDKQSAAWKKASNEDDDVAIEAIEQAWSNVGVVNEAVRLGAIALKQVTSSRQWDFGQVLY